MVKAKMDAAFHVGLTSVGPGDMNICVGEGKKTETDRGEGDLGLLGEGQHVGEGVWVAGGRECKLWLLGEEEMGLEYGTTRALVG